MNRGKTISSRARTSGSWSCLRPYAACTAAPLDGSGRRAVFRSCLRGVRVAVSLRRTKPGSTELSGFSLAHRRESPLRVDPRAESPGSALGAPSIGRTPGPSAPSQGAYSTNGALVIHRAQRFLSLRDPRAAPGVSRASGERVVLCRGGFARCGNETMPLERPARRMMEPCCLANPRPRTRSYGYGSADLLHGRHGPRAPRRRQPVRNGARGTAGDARSPDVAPDRSGAVARCPQGVPPRPSAVAGVRHGVRRLLGNPGRVGTAGSLRRADRTAPDAPLAWPAR